MKIGINLASNILEKRIQAAISESNLPAVIVRHTLENILQTERQREYQALQAESEMYQDELRRQEEKQQEEKQEAEKPAKGE